MPAALHAEKSSHLLTNLNSEFLGKRFQTKLTVGRYATGLTTSPNEQAHLVDTEVDVNGDIKYLVRGLWPAVRISQARVTASFAPGTRLWVWKIETKDDRIEFWLASSETQHTLATYGKLKFMLGKGYESWDYARIEGVIANSLRIERLERLAQLRTDYADLSRQLQAAKVADSSVPVSDLDAQIGSKRHLEDLYGKLAANRIEFASTGQSDTESANFKKEEDNVRAKLNDLVAQRKSQQQSKLNENASALRGRYLALKQQISATRNLQQRQEKIDEAKKNLDELKANYSQQQALGSSVTASDLAWVSTEDRALDAFAADIPNLEAKQRSNELDAQYRAMEQKRNVLQAAYMKAAGTPEQAAAGDALKKHLQVMYENRMVAERAGSKTAKQQAAGLQMVIQHLN
jgi:hypothetical protein